MDRTLQTQFRIEDLRSKDLKRLEVPSTRVYLAHRDNKQYGEEKLYEIAIMSKDGTNIFFATEEDLFSKKYYSVEEVELLEEMPFISLMSGTRMAPMIDSKEIYMCNFGSIYELRFNTIKDKGFKFSDLVKLNRNVLKDQKSYIDRKEKEFEEEQHNHRHKYPLHFQDDDYVFSQER